MNQTINISLPKTMHQDLKDLVEAGHFSSVSEAIRAGINQIKTALHPRYQSIEFGPKAMARFSKAEDDYHSSQTIPIKTLDDLL